MGSVLPQPKDRETNNLAPTEYVSHWLSFQPCSLIFTLQFLVPPIYMVPKKKYYTMLGR